VVSLVADTKVSLAFANPGDVPVYVVGASSGGTFASILTLLGGTFAGSLVMISPGGADVWRKTQPATVRSCARAHIERALQKTNKQAFVHMEGDTWASPARIKAAAASLSAVGVRTASFLVTRRPVTAAFIAERLPEFDAAAAAALVRELAAAGHADASGNLTRDPREFCSRFGRNDPVARNRLCEVLNVAYAQHEMTSDYFKVGRAPWLSPRL